MSTTTRDYLRKIGSVEDLTGGLLVEAELAPPDVTPPDPGISNKSLAQLTNKHLQKS